MTYRRTVRCLLLAVLLAVAPGCQVFHAYRPIAIEARDGETKQPIAGVEVRISYPLEESWLAPAESKGKTNSDGIARLHAAPYGRAGIMLEVSRGGYLSEVKYVTIEEVQAIEPAHWFGDVDRRPARFVMELFADPAPSVDLIAPVGYRGQIKAEVQVQPDLPAASGQRSFSFPVSAAGEVVAAGPALFRHVNSANVRVKFADGRPLSLRAKESALGYWYVKCEGRCYYFFVGTSAEYETYAASLQSPKASGPSDGKGRHGRKGASGDANPFGANP